MVIWLFDINIRHGSIDPYRIGILNYYIAEVDMIMSIRSKLIFGFGMIFAVVIAVFVIQYSSTKKGLDHVEQVESRTLQSALLASDMKLAVVQVQQFLTDVGATVDPAAFAEAEQNASRFESDLDQFAKINPADQEQIEGIRKSFRVYYDMGKKMAQDYITGGTEAGNRTMREFDKTAEDINTKVDSLRQFQIGEITQAITGIKASVRSMIVSQLWSIGVIVILALLIVYGLVRAILVPIRKLVEVSRMIAAGDLSRQVTYSGKDEFGLLSNAFEQMRTKLAMLIGNVQNASLKVAASAEQLSSAADENTGSVNLVAGTIQQISDGAERQSHSTTETARAMEEMAQGIQRVAETTGMVAELSVDAERQAKQGYERIDRAIQQMRTIGDATNRTKGTIAKLDEHSTQISEIVTTIADITRQTNLLALNAGIEAARAGENGKGFAVVAEEIRKLADQTKSASEQVAVILTQIQRDSKLAVSVMDEGAEEVANGMQAMEQAGLSFEEILKASVQIADQLQEVSASTEEMSAGSQQITASVGELSVIAERSFGQARQVSDAMHSQLVSMKEIASSTRSLSELAEQLEQMTLRFQV